ncbi:L-lactate dehydrogenase [Anaeromicropila herbilytica]|uniref:L-lactate dehydrogenase n=1 Tax=Anaeromicropila herbilytica TaxID=2785025 RepID=A0A7R7EPX3_9FIRM|nr:L-lactate dehydrogenase [Anaeromicropila herbilytica]BCN32876.1 L-lactate dehydrogenase 3 [Anaeromicropila herbilytica]
MKSNITKVVIIGAGAVGATTAYSLVVKGIAAEVVLVDINKEKAQGEVWDIQHSIDFQNRNVRIKVGDYKECGDADIVVITASAPMDGETNRLMMLEKTATIIRNIIPPVMESGFDGIFVVVSNPVDVMAYLVKELSGLPKNRVIGTGTILETARLKQKIGEIMGMDPSSIDACVLGEHGDTMMIPWSHVRAGGKNFLEILSDNRDMLQEVDIDSIVQQTKRAGYYVLKSKGNTQYGIAGAVTGIVAAILGNENKLYAVSAYLEGEYGIEGIYLGVPAILNRDGIKDIGVFNLNEEEKEQLIHSADIIRNSIERL